MTTPPRPARDGRLGDFSMAAAILITLALALQSRTQLTYLREHGWTTYLVVGFAVGCFCLVFTGSWLFRLILRAHDGEQVAAQVRAARRRYGLDDTTRE